MLKRMLVLVLCALPGCGTSGSEGDPMVQEVRRLFAQMMRAIELGEKEIGPAADFHRLFPGAVSFISSYSSDKPDWSSQAGLHGRYVLGMQMGITFDAEKLHVVRHEEPLLVLVEVKNVSLGEDGRVSVEYEPASQVTFGAQMWKTLVDSEGDFQAIGVTLVKDKPIRDFDRALHPPVR